MECINCGIDFDSYKFGYRCPDCLHIHESPNNLLVNDGERLYINMDAIPATHTVEDIMRIYREQGLTGLNVISSSVTPIILDDGSLADSSTFTYTIGIDPYR